MVPLDLAIFSAPKGRRLVSCTPLARDVRIATNEHGHATLTATLPLPFAEAQRLYRQYGALYVLCSWNGRRVWAGRLEDPSLFAQETGAGLTITAYGYQNALRDVPYTALWSTQDLSEWRPVQTWEESSRDPARYQFSQDGQRLQIANVKDGSYHWGAAGSLTFETPDGSARDIVYATFDYAGLLPDATWIARLVTWDRNFTNPVAVWTQTGSASLSGVTVGPFTGKPRLMLEVFYLSGTASVVGSQNGSYYARWANLRVASVSGSAPVADEIAKALLTYVRAINSGQLAANTSFIRSPGYQLKEEVYRDEYPADILDHLIKLGDTNVPPRQWTWAVWGQHLYLAPKGYYGRTWYVDAATLQVNRSYSGLTNSAYSVYQDANGTERRTTVATDTDSVLRYGLTRRQAVSASTTNAAQAAVTADAVLLDGARLIPQVGIAFPHVFAPNGLVVPAFLVQADDTIKIRNLPPQLTRAAGVSSFRVVATEYADGVVTVTPESPLPTIDVLLARREEGI